VLGQTAPCYRLILDTKNSNNKNNINNNNNNTTVDDSIKVFIPEN